MFASRKNTCRINIATRRSSSKDAIETMKLAPLSSQVRAKSYFKRNRFVNLFGAIKEMNNLMGSQQTPM